MSDYIFWVLLILFGFVLGFATYGELPKEFSCEKAETEMLAYKTCFAVGQQCRTTTETFIAYYELKYEIEARCE